MEKYIFLIYDIISIAAVSLLIWIGAKNGFANAIIQAGGLILSVVASLALGKILSSLIYTTLVQPGVISAVRESVGNAVDTESVINGLSEAVNSMPWMARKIFDFSAAEKALSENNFIDAESAAIAVESTVIRPVVEPIINTLIFLITIIILVVIVETLAKSSKGVNKIPVVGILNSILGGFTGFVAGMIVILIVAGCVGLYIKLKGENIYLNEEVISKTYIFRYIYNVVQNGVITG